MKEKNLINQKGMAQNSSIVFINSHLLNSNKLRINRRYQANI